MAVTIISTWANVGGIRIHTRVGMPQRGRQAVVLVHGLGVSSRYMVPTARALAPDFDVYAPDLPGSGLSERPAGVLNIAELARTLVRWLDVMQLERPSFLGNSMGCQVLAEHARDAPDRVDRLVLVGPTVDPRWRKLAKQVPRWLLEATREPLSLMPILVRD